MQIIITDADVRFVGDEMKPFADLILDDLEKLSNNDFFFFFQLQNEYLKHFRNVSSGPCRLAPALITPNVLNRRASRRRVIRLQRYQDVMHVDLCRFWFVVLSWYPLACLCRFYNDN